MCEIKQAAQQTTAICLRIAHENAALNEAPGDFVFY